MNLIQEKHNVGAILQHMLSDLSGFHKETDRENLFRHYVNIRLSQSLKNYYAELIRTKDFLMRRDVYNVMKKSLKGDNNRDD